MMSGASTVFLLDDEPEMLKAHGRVLEAHGFRTQAFSNADDFFAYERGEGVACLLLDLAMPEMDGLQVQERLSQDGGALLPIIFITGHGDIPASVKAVKAGAEDFLTKPIDASDLIAAVNRALEQARIRLSQTTEIREFKKRLAGLTDRQRAVFEYVVSGKMNKQIAAELGTGEQNIKIHRRRVMRKMGATTLAELVRIAERLGIDPAH